MSMMVDYGREITVKKPCLENMDRLNIGSSFKTTTNKRTKPKDI